MAKVEQIGESKDNKGSVFVVDPNPPGMDIIPPEDMFIYVKFSAYPRSRTTYGGNTLEGNSFFDSGVEGEVHFISTKISYKDGQLDPPLQKTYATTDWTNIGGFKDENSRSEGILEGFGIKSIDIKYNASLVPVVDITFTDVRGAGLFDVVKNNDRKSPYSIFFKMPYPVFRLSVKGYFGQKVDYCLHMVNWTSNFDGSTGNFDITANFLGFQQAFLNDMVIGNIIGTINTQKGLNNLNRIYDESNSNIGKEGNLDIRKLDEFLTKIARLQVDSEIIKSDLDSYEKLKDLNGKLSLLKEMRTFIGSHMGKQPKSKNEGSTTNTNDVPYIEKENTNSRIFTSGLIQGDLKKDENYLSIRDYIIFNSVDRASFKRYIEVLNDLIFKYNSYITANNIKETTPENTLDGAKNKQNNNGEEKKKTSKDEQLISSFQNSGENSWERYIVSERDKSNKIVPVKLETIIGEFSNENSTLYLKKDWDGGDKNANFKMSLFTGNQNFYVNLKKETTVLVADFRKQRELVEYNIAEVEEEVKKLREDVQKEINEKLLKNFQDKFNFNPTVKKCFEILSNNTQAMVETVYDITFEAEQQNIVSGRQDTLSGLDTDIPTNVESLAWPSVYRPSDGSLEEIYIGELGSVNSTNFPEWQFVEEVFENLVAKTKTLEQITKASSSPNGLDTDNWFPINPIDYKINPWIRLGASNSKEEIVNELVRQFFFRCAILQNYSTFTPNTGLKSLEDYANFDSIAANKTIFSEKTREIIGNILDELKNKQTDYKNTPFFTENITQEGNVFYFNESDDGSILPIYDNFKLSGKFSSQAQYILFDEKPILNNSKKLFKEIQEEPEFTRISDPDAGGSVNANIKKEPLFYKNNYSSAYNLTSNILFNVWDTEVSNKLLKSNNDKISDTFGNTVKITDFNPSGGTYESKFLNLTNFNFTNDVSECAFEDIMTQSKLYEGQSNVYAKGLLLLSTFPFRTFKEAVLDALFPNGVYTGARVVRLPELYVIYLGGLLWRYLEPSNAINFNVSFDSGNCDYSKFETPNNKYLNLGYLRGVSTSKNVNKDLEDELKSLPISVKNKLIDKFKDWAEVNIGSVGEFDDKLTYYVNDGSTGNTFTSTITETQKTSGINFILQRLKETTDMIVLNPRIFNPQETNNPKRLEVSIDDIQNYIERFTDKFKIVGKDNNTGNESDTEKEKTDESASVNKIKLQIYNYFKNINSKWVAQDKKSFNICGGQDRDLIDYFKFIDRGWRNIGEDATFNLKSFLTLGSNLNTSMYLFMSKLLRDSNFLFQILPNYINYKNREEVGKIFQPQTTLQGNDSSGPIFCCIYVGGASEVLDIEEEGSNRSNYYFKNDGYSFNTDGTDTPGDMLSPDDSSLVAFRVSFGAQNQTVFKNVSLSQQEHRETGEYFKALSDLVDKRGGTQKTYVGTDLLRLFKTRSYTCKVDALGCMNIQPLMYFDLQNVPFFNGAYLITSVNHSISPNHMTTNFQGVRQSKYISPPEDKITADLNIDLNETSEIPKIDYTNLSINSGRFNIGVRNGIDPDDLFDYDGNFSDDTGIDNFKELGIVRETDQEYRDIIDNIETIFKANDIKTNAQVTMLLTTMLTNSNNFTTKEKEVTKGVEIKDENNKITYYTNDNITSFNSDSLVEEYKDTYLSSIPTSTITGNSEDIAFTIKENFELEDDANNYKTILDAIKTKQSQINALITTEPNYENNKKKLESDIEKLEKRKQIAFTGSRYGNIFFGDGYRFRPKGYLYVVGRKNYYDLFESFDGKGKQSVENPNVVETEESAIKSAVAVWKGLKDPQNKQKTAYDYSSIKDDGSATTLERCIDISCQYESLDKTKTFDVFEKVLTTFKGKDGQPLIDYDNPKGGIN